MKKTIKSTISIALSLLFLLSLVACNTLKKTQSDVDVPENTGELEKIGVWADATYRMNKELGTGSKTIVVDVVAEDQKVTFTIHTDKETVGDAMMEHDLIEGEEGAYGLYIKKVNGIVADYDKDKHYWAFYLGDDYAMTGVDGTKIEQGVTYRLVRTK